MKILIGRILVACVVLVLGSSVLAQSSRQDNGGSRCSSHTLFGDYGAQNEGTEYIPNDPNPPIKVDLRTISMGHYDGVENVTFRDHVVVDGNPPPQEWREASGTYVVIQIALEGSASTRPPASRRSSSILSS